MRWVMRSEKVFSKDFLHFLFDNFFYVSLFKSVGNDLFMTTNHHTILEQIQIFLGNKKCIKCKYITTLVIILCNSHGNLFYYFSHI